MNRIIKQWLIFQVWFYQVFYRPTFIRWHRARLRFANWLIRLSVSIEDNSQAWLWQHRATQIEERDRYSYGDLEDRY